MRKLRDIPIVELGPGSQRSEQDDRLEYMSMPSDMYTYHQPLLPEPEDTSGLIAGKQILGEVLAALRAWRFGDTVTAIDLGHLAFTDLDFVNQALGEGEVSVAFDAASPIRAQEAVLAGVWRVRHYDTLGRLMRDTIEVGDVPDLVRNAAFNDTDATLDSHCDAQDPTIQNAPALLVELADRLAGFRAGDPLFTINLSLLPLTQGDLMLLGARLGVGPVTILSRGYGNCRIGSTARRNAWWIKYYNSQDALILNTIEVTDVPPVVLAAAEDIADSAERLDEILGLYR